MAVLVVAAFPETIAICRALNSGFAVTDLLPANAWPRQQADLVKAPAEMAEMLWAWIHNADDANKHFVLQSSP